MPIIRHAMPGDLPALVSLESACFPPAEAATREALSARLAAYPNHFWLLFPDAVCGGEAPLVSFVDGFCTDYADLEDWMYEDATGHEESGRWQMIFGVN
ncbi:MAG: GNAT family N-acetyltransferase, partial [Eubacteriales bacterium]